MAVAVAVAVAAGVAAGAAGAMHRLGCATYRPHSCRHRTSRRTETTAAAPGPGRPPQQALLPLRLQRSCTIRS
eukprot:COSAG06_NODE_11760_length_1468_cov_2.074507_2_plen_73_part_00